MSNVIRILPEQLANKIAAGEVVERPASVVKELVENAIDAEATRIHIEVAAGGKQLIRVSDNGTGMSHDDAIMAFERHATSKIAQDTDLHAIVTLGFRGEALPSIGAVSRLLLETCREGEVAGARISMEGGVIRDVAEAGRDVGTTVTVRSLFFNTPARRKFLRGTDTELRRISRTVTDIAIACPEIGFVLSHNGREMLRLPKSTDHLKRIGDVFGATLVREAISVAFETGSVKLSGIIGKPEAARGSAIHQIAFVNRRPVVNKILSHAVYAGYGGILPKNAHPLYVLFLELNPAQVDVNVHPSKREVRFSDDRALHEWVATAVEDSLKREKIVYAPDPPGVDREEQKELRETLESYTPQPKEVAGHQISLPLAPRKPRVNRRAAVERPTQDLSAEGHISLWQVHQKYIFGHIKNGLIMVDQHVAHERVIYEEIMKALSGQRGTAQQLLFPMTMEFSAPEFEALKQIVPFLEQMGFGVQEFGHGRTIMVDAIPADLERWGDGEILRAMVDDLVNTGDVSTDDLREKFATSYSCHTAIKAGDPMSPIEMQGLIDRLFATQNPFTCPHGRPIVVRMPLEEIDRRFGR